MKKKVVYSIGGQEQNREVDFCSDIEQADEIWIYEQDLADKQGNPLLTDEMVQFYKSSGKPIVFRNNTFSPMPRSVRGIGSAIERNKARSTEKGHGRDR